MGKEPVELARCSEHGLVLTEDEDGRMNYCVACETGIEPRPDHDVRGPPLRDEEFRNRLPGELISELVPLMEDYLTDVEDEYDLFVTHKEWDGTLPSGYTEQERFVPIIAYTMGARVKYLTETSSAEQTIETLRENGYGDA